MKTDITAKGLDLTPSMKQYIARRLGFALGARAQQIQRVKVSLTDVNGPKGGVDKSCKIVIQVAGMNDIVVTESKENWQSAIDRSAAKASQSLARRLGRQNFRRGHFLPEAV